MHEGDGITGLWGWQFQGRNEAPKLTVIVGSGIIGFAFCTETATAYHFAWESGMTKHPHEQNSNPLEDLADNLSTSLQGNTVDIHNTSVGKIEGGRVSMAKSAARAVQASAMDMEESAAMLVQAKSLEMENSGALAIVCKEASLDNSAVSVLAASSVSAQDTKVGLLLAGRVEGTVKPVLTPLGAFAFGAGVGLAATALKELVRLLWRQRS